MTDTYADGTKSIIAVLRPRKTGWQEITMDQRFTLGYPARAYFHVRHQLAVISAVEVASDAVIEKGPEYHLSISKQSPITGTHRCTSSEARWILDQFGLEGAEEDNHVPGGLVRNFWRPVADRLVGLECECKADEPAMIEDKGEFVWRGAPK